MNILEKQAVLKDLSDDQLNEMLQGGAGSVPQFLVMSELKDRADMRLEQKNDQLPPATSTVREDVMSGGIKQFAEGGAVYPDTWGKSTLDVMRERALDPRTYIPYPLRKAHELGVQVGGGIKDFFTKPYIPMTPGVQSTKADRLPVAAQPVEPTPQPNAVPATFADPYGVSDLVGRLGSIESMMQNRGTSLDGGYGDYIAALKQQQSVNNENNKAMALARMGFAIAGGTSPNALTNVAQGANDGIAAYVDALNKQQAGAQKILEQGLHKEAAKKAYEEGRVNDAIKLFGSYAKLKNVEISAAASKAKVALQALKAKGNNGDAKMLEVFVKNLDKIATMDPERQKPILDAVDSLVQKAMSGAIQFDLDAIKKQRSMLEEEE
jgi:hypothetical protein